jgi:hypothetical protein
MLYHISGCAYDLSFDRITCITLNGLLIAFIELNAKFKFCMVMMMMLMFEQCVVRFRW